MSPFTTRAGAIAVVAAIAALLPAGCGEDAPENPAAPEDETDNGILTDLTDPLEVVAAHVQALSAMDAAAYTALLETPAPADGVPGFRFYLLDRDAQDFGWLVQSFWGYTQETAFIGNMCDPVFAGGSPPVLSIAAVSNVLSKLPLQPGLHEITADAVFTVLTGPSAGFAADTRFVFTIAEQADGYLRIREIREIEKLKRAGRSVEQKSWGAVKGLYHSPTHFDDPLEVVAAHFGALGQMDAVAYADLLEQPVAGDSTQGFRFYLLDKDAQDFTWLTNDWWDLTQEMMFIGHMCDPEFAGSIPPAQSISATYILLQNQEVQPGIHELMTDAVIIVLTGPNDGFSADTRLVFTVAEQAGGSLRIRTIREVEKLKRASAAHRESTGWGAIKALYR